MSRTYYAHREHYSSYDADVFTHIASHRQITRLYGDSEIFEVTIRAANDGEISPYWGWLDFSKDEFCMIYPSMAQARCCFPYGPEAEEKAGRGRLINLVVEAKQGEAR